MSDHFINDIRSRELRERHQPPPEIPRLTPGGFLLGVGAMLLASALILGVYVLVREAIL